MTPPTTAALSSAVHENEAASKKGQKRAWWWRGADARSVPASSEIEVLGAAVLCAAIAASTTTSTAVTNAEEKQSAIHELETHIRASPLPHRLKFPILEFATDYVLMESENAVICAVRATKNSDILEAVLGSTMPLSQPYEYRFGGARVHVPFWKRARQLDLQTAYRKARREKKMLIVCGHSIGGSIAQLGVCELVYQYLPIQMRLSMEQMDVDKKKYDKEKRSNEGPTTKKPESLVMGFTEGSEEYETFIRNLPNVMAVGFGAPYISSNELNQSFLEPLGMTKRVLTFVNEFDCIPSILNVAQSAAMITKTTERFVTITKATKTLLNLLPAQMQQCFLPLASSTAGAASSASPTSMYLTMSLNILQNTFQKFRDYNIVKEIDYQYAPCGTYIFLKKDSTEFQISSDSTTIQRLLNEGEDASTTLTGNSILQHLMSAYVDAVAKRSTSIQINATMNYYERLNVPRNATPKQIRSAYKALALKWHPDRWAHASVHPQEQETAEQVFKLLAESYEVLSDPEARKAYDTHLSKGSSLTDEFVRHGTVNGMTLDEAIATFRDAIDGLTGAVSRVSSRFSSSSSSTAVSQPIRLRSVPEPPSSGFVANNHDNLFAPDRVRVVRKIEIGTEAQERIMYLQPDEIIPGDVAAPTQSASASTNVGLRTISVVGGAVAVGASVALLVNAWSHYSESSKKRYQAEAVRSMPVEYLMLLMDDHRKTSEQQQHSPQQLLLNERSGQKQPTQDVLALGEQQALVAQQQRMEEDALMEEFFECMNEYDLATTEAFAEEEFFDCVELERDVATFFNDANDEEHDAMEVQTIEPTEESVMFPVGAAVSTPFGLGVIEDWRPNAPTSVVRLTGTGCIGYIHKPVITRGAALAVEAKSEVVETKRAALAERVIKQYKLEEGTTNGTIMALVDASKQGALDSGMRAAGGVVLAKGMARTSTALGGAVAAPLTIASILVDLGKEYYEYRQKHAERQTLGVLSEASERLMMQEFRLKAGQHIVSGTAAAAGATLGAYSMASAIGFWTGVGIAGPVGVVAATGAAVVGGMLGFFAGSKAYTGYTASYFTSQQHAKEHIDRLELGARVLFNEFDPDGKGEISKEDCIQLMAKLYEASSAVSEGGYQSAITVLQDEAFEGPVTWAMFWEWVSSEAARSLRKMEHEEAKQLTEPVAGETWWASYMQYFTYPKPEKVAPQSSMYPSVYRALRFTERAPVTLEEDDEEMGTIVVEDDQFVVLKAQVEYLVNSGYLTVGEAFQLNEQLASDDPAVQFSARQTIKNLHEDEVAKVDDESTMIYEGFGGSDAIETTNILDNEELKPLAPPMTQSPRNPAVHFSHPTRFTCDNNPRKRKISNTATQMDVMCSLMSTQGLQNFLQSQSIVPENTQRHEDLHCLALLAAEPPGSPKHSMY